jgi:hypothetical protein
MTWQLPPKDSPFWPTLQLALKTVHGLAAVVGIALLVWHLHGGHSLTPDRDDAAGLLGGGVLALLARQLYQSRAT